MKKTPQMNKVLVPFFLFFLGLNPNFAQDFSQINELEKVQHSGWYKIYLTEEFRGFLRPDFADIRLFSLQNMQQEIPYILREEPLRFSKDQTGNLLNSPLKGIRYNIQHLANKTSLVKVFSNHKQWIHQVAFQIKEPMYFARDIRAYTKDWVQTGRRKRSWQETPIAHYELRAYGRQSFAMNQYMSDTLFIEIENLDNPPLQIQDIQFYQQELYLYAYLNKGELYCLKSGNAALQRPQYDLESFAKLIQDSVSKTLQMKPVKAELVQEITVSEIPFYEQKYFLWLCLIIGVITLFFFSWKLLQEKKNS